MCLVCCCRLNESSALCFCVAKSEYFPYSLHLLMFSNCSDAPPLSTRLSLCFCAELGFASTTLHSEMWPKSIVDTTGCQSEDSITSDALVCQFLQWLSAVYWQIASKRKSWLRKEGRFLLINIPVDVMAVTLSLTPCSQDNLFDSLWME